MDQFSHALLPINTLQRVQQQFPREKTMYVLPRSLLAGGPTVIRQRSAGGWLRSTPKPYRFESIFKLCYDSQPRLPPRD